MLKEFVEKILEDKTYEYEIVAVEHPEGGIAIIVITGEGRKSYAKFIRENHQESIVEDLTNRDDITSMRYIEAKNLDSFQ